MNGADILDPGLNLASMQPGALRITNSPNAGEVSGIVQDRESKPVANAQVVLIPVKTVLRDDPLAYRTATTTPEGNFSIKTIRPGDYRAYAWKPSVGGAYMDPAFVNLHTSKGKAITIAEGSAASINLDILAGDLP